MASVLRSLYSYHFVQRLAVDDGDADGEFKAGGVERSVRQHMAAADREFYGGRYREALQDYQLAYSELFRFLHPDFPSHIFAGSLAALAAIDVTDPLIRAAGEIGKFRVVAGPDALLGVPEPPPPIQDLVSRFDASASVARTLYKVGLSYTSIGAMEQADRLLRGAIAAAGNDMELQAHAQLARGVALGARDQDSAIESFTAASNLYAQLGMAREQAAANNNLGVLHTLAGNSQAAGVAFAAAADRLPLALGRTLTQSLNPGAASTLSRPMGADGLEMMVRAPAAANEWVAMPTAQQVSGAASLNVLVADHMLPLSLQGDPVVELRQKLLQPRVAATTLLELAPHFHHAPNFVAHLAHLNGFTLPMSIGDCYLETGEFDAALEWYQRARAYPFLNQAIEAPVVWRKMATAYVRSANLLYRDGDKNAARGRYEKIVRLDSPEQDPASPLYVSPVFDAMQAEVQALLAASPPPDPTQHDPAVSAIVLLAQQNLRNIASGIDFPLLSLTPEAIPVFRFDYLQNVARYFAQHATECERVYIQFKTSAEQGQLTRASMESAVTLAQANETLEAQKVNLAAKQKAAIDANAAAAQVQLDDANKLRAQYAAISKQQNAVDAELAYVGASTQEYDFHGYAGYGVPDGKHRVDEVLRTLTQKRQELSQRAETANLDARVKDLEAARNAAQAQQPVGDAQLATAKTEQWVATLNRESAEQQLALFNSQEFTPELWNRLATEMRVLSEDYLRQAVDLARLMERTYEFEIGEPVGIIKPSYSRSSLSGLLAGDFLQRDIDYFTVLRVAQTQKRQPVKEVISLADSFPIQFMRDFQSTGRMHFQTSLADFDRNFPGGYQLRMRRVEVVVEGLIGPGGLHGTLVNTGLSFTRRANGGIQMRLLQPETLLLSSYRIGPDSIVFTPADDMLAIFEGSPVATSWTLELRPAVNNLVYQYVTDVKLVMYYDAFYSDALKQDVLERLAETEPLTAKRSIALRYEMFDDFFALQDSGEVEFSIAETMLPFYHKAPHVGDLTVLVQTGKPELSLAGLVVEVTAADGTQVTQTTDASGAISSGAAAPLSSLVGQALLQRWRIAIPRAANQARFDAGLQWSDISNIVVVADYQFTPRTAIGEPVPLVLDEFAADPLGDFDAVDDAQANQGSPSNWSFLPGAGVAQTSSISGGNANNDAVKPGTYLVRKTSAEVPALNDFIASTNIRSAGGNAIGLVFRWLDEGNFYFFLMDNVQGYRRLGKKQAGTFGELSTVAFDDGSGYTPADPHHIRVRVQGSRIDAYLDDALILSGSDAALTIPGRVGFFAWNNTQAQFRDLRLVRL